MKLREIYALRDAAERPGGWGLFKRSTTEKLAAIGYFERAEHSMYGSQFRITDAGRDALKQATASPDLKDSQQPKVSD